MLKDPFPEVYALKLLLFLWRLFLLLLLLLLFSKDQFPEFYMPTVCENHFADMELDGGQVVVGCSCSCVVVGCHRRRRFPSHVCSRGWQSPLSLTWILTFFGFHSG